MYCTFSCFNKQANYIRLYVLRPAQAVNFMFCPFGQICKICNSLFYRNCIVAAVQNLQLELEERGGKNILFIQLLLLLLLHHTICNIKNDLAI